MASAVVCPVVSARDNSLIVFGSTTIVGIGDRGSGIRGSGEFACGVVVPLRRPQRRRGFRERFEQRSEFGQATALRIVNRHIQPRFHRHSRTAYSDGVRHTKIVATVGPSSDSDETIQALIGAGVDVFRLNFSHGTHETHGAAIARIRAASDAAGRHVAIMQDLSGPKIRTGELKDHAPVNLKSGDSLRVVVGDAPGDREQISTTFELTRAVAPGSTLLLDDGHIQLRVDDVTGKEIRTTVVDGGTLGEHKGINVPGAVLPTTALTAKDADDLAFGVSKGVDYVALSFVQTAADLQQARDMLHRAGAGRTPLVAKLERPEAVDHVDDILAACDAIMVARGDLGLELPLERVPRVQKEVTRKARARGIPVIVATQVLESMRTEPRPTRAEVSDAANAVDDGVDAIMLAGETAAGNFPVKAVQTLDLIIRDAEQMPAATFIPL